jgi:hypothetical protein
MLEMVSIDKYVPILKGKQGEFMALEKLDTHVKDSIVPVIDLVGFVPNPKKPEKDFDNHIRTTLKYFSRYWELNRKTYVDGYMIEDFGMLSSGVHPMKYVFDRLRAKNFDVVPVISTSTSVEYNQAIKDIIKRDNKGTCIRIFRNSFNDIDNVINRLLDFLELAPSSVDLLIDLRELGNDSIEELYDLSVKILSVIKFGAEWRSLILSGGSFPFDLTDVQSDAIHYIPRKEWHIWEKIFRESGLERLPSFSDYAISNPRIALFDYVPNASASIRYSLDSDHCVYRGLGTIKGRGARRGGFRQFYDLSESLINSPDYYTESHCVGDKFIHKCAMDRRNTGSLKTWRWVGTNHHLTVVSNQLRQFFLDFNASQTS